MKLIHILQEMEETNAKLEKNRSIFRCLADICISGDSVGSVKTVDEFKKLCDKMEIPVSVLDEHVVEEDDCLFYINLANGETLEIYIEETRNGKFLCTL